LSEVKDAIQNREKISPQQPEVIAIWVCHEGIPKEDTVFKNRRTGLLPDKATTDILHKIAITIPNI
jgi:hypothetical protein